MRVWRTTALLAGVCGLGTFAIAAAPQKPASANVLSEHHLEALDGMSPQQQAELLLERAINHYRGATTEIAARAPRWRGKITLDERLNRLFVTSINSDDLAVRIAGIEVDIAARNLITDPSTVDRLEATARTGAQGPRVNALWDLALIGNRGVEPDRIFEILMASLHDENHNIRYWAVEGLAFLAADAAIEPLLEMFHDDPSPTIRERAACSLAQSGMFSAAQRRKAIPRLLDFADDSTLDDQTRSWVFQALRDITGESLPRDAHTWREWYRRYRGPAER
jgi:HEAT repeat protein